MKRRILIAAIVAAGLFAAGVAGAAVEKFRWTAVPKPTVALVADVWDCQLFKIETEGRIIYMTKATTSYASCPMVLVPPDRPPVANKG